VLVEPPLAPEPAPPGIVCTASLEDEQAAASDAAQALIKIQRAGSVKETDKAMREDTISSRG
jgi:hypothetical protein